MLVHPVTVIKRLAHVGERQRPVELGANVFPRLWTDAGRLNVHAEPSEELKLPTLTICNCRSSSDRQPPLPLRSQAANWLPEPRPASFPAGRRLLPHCCRWSIACG